MISSLLITFINYEVEIVYLYLIYLFIAVVYTKSLKFVNFIDSIAISTLFLIRLTIGGIVVNLDITIFLYIFTFFYFYVHRIFEKKFNFAQKVIR